MCPAQPSGSYQPTYQGGQPAYQYQAPSPQARGQQGYTNYQYQGPGQYQGGSNYAPYKYRGAMDMNNQYQGGQYQSGQYQGSHNQGAQFQSGQGQYQGSFNQGAPQYSSNYQSGAQYTSANTPGQGYQYQGSSAQYRGQLQQSWQAQPAYPAQGSYNQGYNQQNWQAQPANQAPAQPGYSCGSSVPRYQPACAPRCAPCEQPCAPKCAPACPAPCVPKCAPACPAPCAPKCAPRCAPRCEPKCRPFCKPRCEPRCAPACPAPCAPAAPVCPQPQPGYGPAPVAAPIAPGGCYGQAPAPQWLPESQCYGNFVSINTSDDCLVSISQRAPSFATVGTPYPIELYLTAQKDCANVVVTQNLHHDAVFIRSEPPLQMNPNRQLLWNFETLKAGETQRLVIWIKPEKEGCCFFPVTVCACPQICGVVQCGQPIICIKKCGPECVCINCDVVFNIEVTNSGSATAYDVVVTDNVPEGLCHESGMRTLTFPLGNLGPCESRSLCVNLKALRRGYYCNTAMVSYCGGPQCTAEACVNVVEPCVRVTKCGPDWAYICKTVDYTITVTNPGDLILRDVQVVDTSAPGTIIVAAPGADVCCSTATWNICELCPGETQTFTVTVRSQVTGNLCNKVTVTSNSDCGCCTEVAEACTLWRGIPAIHMCMVDTHDPICIGDTTVYRVTVTNQGTADDDNVQLVVRFTDELLPQSANGPTAGYINGNTVTFDPIPKLGPKQTVEYVINVRGVSCGDGRAEATLTSDMLSAPVTDNESTHVY